MAKPPNSAGSKNIYVTVSVQSERLLEELAKQGIYGRNPAEVAGRFIDQALQQFIERPRLKVKLRGTRQRD